ncbi:hypothetical protein FOA52_007145 [Chlamydomonas sp. UWO 241]|nr:hypothetical protein FOA52_007145 [Chlamydomonas sp. UWO 241]
MWTALVLALCVFSALLACAQTVDQLTEPSSCYVLVRSLPERECQLWIDDCTVPSVVQADHCTLCSRGWGTYATELECLVPPTQGPGPVGASPIDPYSYPAPHQPSNSGCSSDTRSWLDTRPSDAGSACPHLQPGLSRWEIDQTWKSVGGGVPSNGASVKLPENTRVLVTACSFGSGAKLRSIEIPASSQLIFDDSDLLLTVSAIWVSGRLSLGSADCRLKSNIMITFSSQLGIGDADLGIQVKPGGQLDLHGAWFNPTWTRLAATAAAGQNWVTLKDAVNWQPMQLVAVMTSMFRDEATNQNEVMTINYVESGGKRVVFVENFQFHHYGGSEYQTEVALLSRSITLQGGPESVSRSKGGHVKVMGQARLQGIAAFRMGQRNLLGFYPFHFHHVGWVNGESYASDCAVYNSFYRCFVVHGTHNLVLKDNVAFHAAGHCYYLEDGVEEHNRFEHNLAAFVHVIGKPAGGPSQDGTTHAQDWSSLAQPADAAASGFYVSNSNNEFVGNAASGGWAGYSFPRLEAPTGDYAWMTDFIPHQRPLKLFDGNTVHSSGYYFNMAGGIYVGGKLWINTGDSNKLYYSSGRWAHDTRDEQGDPATMFFTNCKAWLAQWGISHWGDRVAVDHWEAHDCTRGANIFGDASLSNVLITGQSANVWSDFPGNLYELDPIAGFRWYDTSVRTVLSNIKFRNFALKSNVEPAFRPSVWYTMPASDEFKPSYISASRGITYENVDFRAFLNNAPIDTGASRYFNWIDWDGSASRRGKATVIGSWPQWWQLDSGCQPDSSSASWICDWLPWRGVARLDVHVSGYTAVVNTFSAVPPTLENRGGYAAQFGYRGSDKRSTVITRNEGITGVAGNGGWYVHLEEGAPQSMQVYPTQLPPGMSIMFATRFPPGTTFSIKRTFKWFPGFNAQLYKAGSLWDLQYGNGEAYFFDGKHLYIRMSDPGDGSVPAPFTYDGVTIWGERTDSLFYDITATNLNCGNKAWGQFCKMSDEWNDIPDFLPDGYKSWTEAYCYDIAPNQQYTCAQQAGFGKCGDGVMFNNLGGYAAEVGSYCAVTCKRCSQGGAVCGDKVPPASGSRTCVQRRDAGDCYQDWFKRDGYCARTCGFCGGDGTAPCVEIVPTDGNSCAQRKAWGSCSESWMIDNHYCDVTCGRCVSSGGGTSGGSTPPPRPPPPLGSSNVCVDKTPSDGISCAQRMSWGNCGDSWMVDGGYCDATCGRCGSSGVCVDTTPTDGISCAQRMSWGNCGDSWMVGGGFCDATCGRCGSSDGACVDKQVNDGYTCAQRLSWGNCGDSWMVDGGFCAATCGRCGSSDGACVDKQVNDGYTCAERLKWGNCGDSWMADGGFCDATCGRCGSSVACVDKQVNDGYTCAQRLSWGNCGDSWMVGGGFCDATCGRCRPSASGAGSANASTDASVTNSSATANASAAASGTESANASTNASATNSSGPEPAQGMGPASSATANASANASGTASANASANASVTNGSDPEPAQGVGSASSITANASATASGTDSASASTNASVTNSRDTESAQGVGSASSATANASATASGTDFGTESADASTDASVTNASDATSDPGPPTNLGAPSQGDAVLPPGVTCDDPVAATLTICAAAAAPRSSASASAWLATNASMWSTPQVPQQPAAPGNPPMPHSPLSVPPPYPPT